MNEVYEPPIDEAEIKKAWEEQEAYFDSQVPQPTQEDLERDERLLSDPDMTQDSYVRLREMFARGDEELAIATREYIKNREIENIARKIRIYQMTLDNRDKNNGKIINEFEPTKSKSTELMNIELIALKMKLKAFQAKNYDEFKEVMENPSNLD